MKKGHLSFILMALLFIIFIFSCTNPEKEFKKAKKVNTIEGYENYLERFTESEYVEDAQFAICSLEFNLAVEQNTIAGLENFLKKYPESEHADDAMSAICTIEFDRAIKLNTIDDYQQFLNKYPNSIHSDRVISNLASLVFDNIKQIDSTENYLTFITEYPQTIYADSARSIINFKEIKDKNDDGKIVKYEHKFREGTFISYERLRSFYNWNNDDSIYPGENNFTVSIGDRGTSRFEGDIIMGNIRFIGMVIFYRDVVKVYENTRIIYPTKS